eukprot:snap_masked-scaffold_65-processed-gene-0.49-mRNA-1 protein AED:1.00 eAED:1.00 QI:0/0/0/0/1/1/2/0/61
MKHRCRIFLNYWDINQKAFTKLLGLLQGSSKSHLPQGKIDQKQQLKPENRFSGNNFVSTLL